MNETGDRRQSERLPCTGVVTLEIEDGGYKGSSLVGLVTDISNNGICIVLDGGQFDPGSAVRIEFSDRLQLGGWIVHCQRVAEGSRVGIAFGTKVSTGVSAESAGERLTTLPIDS